MQIVCPSCHTGFRLDPVALGPQGRKVRCTRCRTIWFAAAADAAPEPAVVALEAGDRPEAGSPPVPSVVLPEIVSWQDAAVVDASASPPLAPADPRAIEASAQDATIGDAARIRSWTPPKRKNRAKAGQGRARLLAVSVLLATVLVVAVGSRASIVRAVPDLAGFFAFVGLPVNLRGLEFEGVKTTHEMQDGISVLVIEGEVVNVSAQPVELPRVRLAVLGPGNTELYSWTALLPRSVLSEGERIAFRSRLASPPVEGREVLVRFLNRADLTASTR